MKTKTAILLIIVILLSSCGGKIGGCNKTCYDIEKTTNLKSIDWNNWNDAYTVYYNFYDNEEDACFDHDGDTIMCYGTMCGSSYDDINLEVIGGDNNLQLIFNMHGSEIDSINNLLNDTIHSDTCFVKGILRIFQYDIQCCKIVIPAITLNRIEDIFFK